MKLFSRSDHAHKIYDEKHSINKFFGEQDVFLTINEKYIHAQTFSNIFGSAILVKEYEWAEEFVNKYKDKLLPGIRENTYNYCLALIYFHKKKYEKSIALLGRIEFPSLAYNLDVRICSIMNYYELNLYDQLVSSIDAFKHFISENKNFPEYRMDWANVSLKFVNKIVTAKFGNKKLDYADYKEAESVASFMSRRWVLQKMKELL